MDLLCFEVKLACRRLGRRKGHTLLILSTFTLTLTLALLSWSLFSAVFLRQPDFDPQGTLHVVLQTTPAGGQERAFPQEVEAWAAHQQVFADYGRMKQPRAMLLATREGNERLSATFLDSQALRMVRAQPLLGRLFTAEEDAPGGPAALLLGHGFWQRHYGGDPGVLGRVLVVDGVPATVVGVMPASFRFPQEQDAWASVGYDPSSGRQTSPTFDVLVRLRPGFTARQAEEQLARIAADTREGAGRRELKPIVVPLNDVYISATQRTAAVVLAVLSAIFVLMSCANTANLVLIDFMARADEFGTSAALGVPRSALVRGAFWQVALITGAATAAAVYLVMVGGPWVFTLAQTNALPYWIALEWNSCFWSAALGLGALSAVTAVVAPALLIFSGRAEAASRQGAVARGSMRYAWRRGLLITQVALLTVLGCATGLLLKSQSRIADIAYGFDPANVLTLRLALASEEFPSGELRRRAFEHVLQEIRALPDVAAASLSSGMPGVGGGAEVIFDADRRVVEDRSGPLTSQLLVVTDEFFPSLKLRWVAGDAFPREPSADRTDYAVITRGLAERLWPGQDALGRTLFARQRSDIRGRVRELVVRGVVEDFLAINLLSERQDGIYTHISRDGHLAFNLFVRGRNGMPSADTIARAIRRAEPKIIASNPRALAERIDGNIAVLRLTARLTTAFTIAAALLGGIGIYSLTATLMAQRTREFGIRLALGGSPSRLWTGFAGSHLAGAGLGVVVGLVLATIAAPVLAALLYRVPARDYTVFAGGAISVCALAAIACGPSWRRLRKINPADCLRSL